MLQIAAQFNDAAEDDIQTSSKEKDVCCICLSEMNKVGHVKKMTCNHLLHTMCIIEVVEKARSAETALCPLCRVSILIDALYTYTVSIEIMNGLCQT